MTEARALAGADIFVPEDEAKPLAEDVFYEHQLQGCRVVTTDGAEVGVVEGVLSAGESDLLVIRSEAKKEILIPFNREICRTVDVASGRIVIDPPDGLLDLNEI
jgi:16S rRNA processing protein RimM